MRLLCYTLLLIVVLFVTNSEATSAIKNSDQNGVSELTASDIDVLTRILAADDGDKRLLRGTAKTDGTGLSADDEERIGKLPGSLTKLFSSISTQTTKFKEGMLTTAFNHLAKSHITPDKLSKRLHLGKGNVESRLAKFHTKFTTWWDANYARAIVPV